jgi:gliding motility-associated-like protein
MKTIPFRKWLKCIIVCTLIFLYFNANTQVTGLQANFSVDVTKGCAPIVVSFKDSSLGNPTSWKWDFGNGTVSSLKNPSVTYLQAGIYSVKLIVFKNNTSDTLIKNAFINVYPKPTVNFSAENIVGCYPLQPQFKDLSTAINDTIKQWLWDFGNGDTSHQQHPNYTYLQQGNFNVKLKATTANGCFDVIEKNAFIKINGGVKAAFNFTAPQAVCTAPAIINFHNNSTGTGVLNYVWNFGDGNSSNTKNPTHQYTTNGIYTVQLIVNNNLGCTDTLKINNAISIGNIKANFNIPASICVGTALHLQNTSLPSSVNAQWYFSDGTVQQGIHTSKIFSLPGIYNITLVNNFGACTDSVTKTIEVLSKPQAKFSANKTTACTVPLQVSFTNETTGGISYKWNFGNTLTSVNENDTTVYSQPGNYDVSLIATNTNGCSDTAIYKNYIAIVYPEIRNIVATPKEGCLPLPVTFNANVVSIDSVTNYLWNFGDGNTSTEKIPTHTYTTEGKFTISLNISTQQGCTAMLQLADYVQAGNKPDANFVADVTSACAESAINFTDSTKGATPTAWYWSFGDGKNSYLQNPYNIFQDTGYQNIRLIVWSYGCSDTAVKSNYVYILPPVADFKFAIDDCDNLLKVRFIDSSKGANTYLWDFGDGSTSTDANPIHVYSNSGKYDVKLTTQNGSCSRSKLKTLEVDNKKGIIDIINDDICKNATLEISLTNNHSYLQAAYWWFIGDDSLQTGINSINYKFTQNGNFPIKVVVKYVNECVDTIFYNGTIKVNGPTASFHKPIAAICAGNQVAFNSNAVAGNNIPIVNYIWQTGDGNTANISLPNYTHTYLNGGTYTIKHTVTDAKGCSDSVVMPNAIKVAQPKAIFTAMDTLVCPGTMVQFNNQSSGNLLNYQWNLGNGIITNQTNPSTTYQQGTYTIQLIATDDLGCADTLTKNNLLKVYLPKASFTVSDSFAVCPPLLVNVTNTSLYAGTSSWTFGDGSVSTNLNPSNLYTYPGNYNLTLLVTNTGGCKDSVTKQIKVLGPTGTFIYPAITACIPVNVNLKANSTNAVKYIWDYNNGVTQTTTINTNSYTYTVGGNYIPKLILEDAQGCRVPVPGVDTIKAKFIEALAKVSQTLICDSATIKLTDISNTNDVITHYKWQLNNAVVSTVASPFITLKNTGTYNVKFVAKTKTGCADSIVYNSLIKVAATPKIKVNGDSAVCKNGQLQFTANQLNADTSVINWLWNFGNGITSVQQNPPAINFNNAGLSTIQLQVKSSNGCSTTIHKNIVVHDLPNVNIGNDTVICRNQSLPIKATGAATYTWYNSNNTLSCINCSTTIAKPLTDISYMVEGKTSFGCKGYDTINIKVQQPQKLSLAKFDTLCLGESRVYTATGTDKYTWWPTTYLSNANAATVTFKPLKDTLIKYTLIGTDNYACFRDTAYLSVKTYPIPKFNILDKEMNVNAGTSLKITTTSSSDIAKWQWLPAINIQNPNVAEPIITARENIKYTCIASNLGKCSTRQEITINVVCNNGNIFLPNTFSPNKDGQNDIFYPRGKGIFNIKSFRIFNRWGELVFERANFKANDASYGWDGTYKGKELPNDAYVYSIEIMCDNTNITAAKGTITLLK